MGSADSLRVALMRSSHGTWVFPKGGIEPGETPEEAARREIEEEVGAAELDLRGSLGFTEHEFERGGRRLRKRVDWYLFESPPGTELRPNPDQNSLDCGWFAPQEALTLVSHADQRRLLRRALAMLG